MADFQICISVPLNVRLLYIQILSQTLNST